MCPTVVTLSPLPCDLASLLPRHSITLLWHLISSRGSWGCSRRFYVHGAWCMVPLHIDIGVGAGECVLVVRDRIILYSIYHLSKVCGNLKFTKVLNFLDFVFWFKV